MALTSPVITKFTNAMAIKDGTGTPLKLNPILLTTGDLNIGGLSPDQKELVEVIVRGAYNSTQKGNVTFPSLSFSAKLADVTDLTATMVGTLIDFFMGTATTPFAARASTMNTASNRKGNATGFDFCWIIERSDFGGVDQFVQAKDVTIEWSIDESPDDGVTLSITGTVHGGVTYVQTLPTGF